jgi:spermidine synthase
MQWVPRHALDEADYRAIIRTASSVFPHTTLWFTGGTHTFVVATPERFTAASLKAALAEGAENPIVWDHLGPPAVIAGYLLMSETELATYVGAGRVVTDNNAYFIPSMRLRSGR